MTMTRSLFTRIIALICELFPDRNERYSDQRIKMSLLCHRRFRFMFAYLFAKYWLYYTGGKLVRYNLTKLIS